ncbi:MAG: hypothetical protein R3F65_32845 [bacterium]|nr:hypothetical protein [Myxococcales bacterium]
MKQVMALAATMMMLVGCGGSEPKAEAPVVDNGPPAWTCEFSNGQTPTVRTEKRRDAMQLCKDYAAQNNMEDSTLIRVEPAK